MNLAVVGWAADSGVGRELIDALRNLPVSSAFILSNPSKPTRKDLISVPHRLATSADPKKEMEDFVDAYRPDTVLTWEVPGSWSFPDLWAAKGIRWVHMVHWDWFAPEHECLWRRATLLAPNPMCRTELKARGLDSILLPVPIDTLRFRFRQRTIAKEFISVYGYGGANDRRSLGEVFGAWYGMSKPPSLTVLSQKEPAELSRLKRISSIRVLLGNAPEPWDLYESGDVAVQPSRYEGVGVSLLEAQACGVPVVAVDAPPMNWIAPDLLVPVQSTLSIGLMGKSVPSHVPSVDGLRRIIESLKGRDISSLSRRARDRVEKDYSWVSLKPKWMDVLTGRVS